VPLLVILALFVAMLPTSIFPAHVLRAVYFAP
jgi:hypothetical protein